jgi:3-methyladenine DNA glycosylase AlkD
MSRKAKADPTAGIMAKTISDDIRCLSQLNVPAVRQLLRHYARHLRLHNASDQLILELTHALAKVRNWPERLVAFELISRYPKAFAQLKAAEIKDWAVGLADWVSVDLFGCTIVGQAWRAGIVTDKLVAMWAKSPDRWLRRLSLVATVPLNNKTRGGLGDSTRTLNVCAMHVDDRDDMVVKALSWALRELAKQNPISVKQFLQKYEDQLAPRVLREVGNKLNTGLKNPSRKSLIK